ncbi:MAG: sortase [Anaerolineales bacterium]
MKKAKRGRERLISAPLCFFHPLVRILKTSVSFLSNRSHALQDQLRETQNLGSGTFVFTTFLDLSGPDISTGSAEQTLGEVQSHVEERYGGDDVEMYFSRMPKHIQIPVIELEADIGFATLRDVEVNGKKFQQWVAPDFVVGWHFTSAPLGEPGNTVLNGHHNINGEVFKNLHLVQIGDEIILSSDVGVYHYQVASVMILPEKYESEEVRLQNAKWIQPSEDERITLITCWPYESNTHRVIVVALPSEEIQSVKN